MPLDAHHVEREEVLSFEEIDRLVRVAVSLGWRKVRLTGGEPLVRRDLVDLVARLARHKENGLTQLVMTTNAILLDRFAPALAAAGLDRVNISLDTLRRDRFTDITRYDKLDAVLSGLDAAVSAGLAPVKINTVLIRGVTDDEIEDFVELARTRPIDLRFIEFMPFGGNGWTAEQVLRSDDLRARIEAIAPLTPLEREADAGPAQGFTSAGWAGRVAFISPISDRAFCSRCNRVRLTSEGRLRGCLLNENEMDFRALMRAGGSDEDVANLFRKAIGLKPEEHPFHRDLAAGVATGPTDGRAMHRIGG